MECPARAFAVDQGTHMRSTSPALLIGNYVDEMLFEGKCDRDLSSLMKKKEGTLLKTHSYILSIIDEMRSDKTFMKYVTGKTQEQLFFDIDGIPWKGKLDVIPNAFEDMIVDLKTAAKIDDWMYSARHGGRVPFYYARGYDIQAAVYCYAWKRDRFVLAIATKTKPSGRYLIEFPKEAISNAWQYVLANQHKVFHEYMKGTGFDYCQAPDCDHCAGKRKTILTMASVFTPKEDTPF